LAFTQVADAVELWTAAAVQAGHVITEGAMKKLYAFFCDRRPCGRALAPALSLNVSGGGGGAIVCAPTEEPATAVERWASSLADQGRAIGAGTVRSAMAWFCAVLESITGRRPARDTFKPLYLAQIELVFHDS